MTRTDRGASTVLDVCLFCLLVGAAVATLSGVPAPQDDRASDRADATASALGRATVTVAYDLRAPGDTAETSLSRRHHDTVAGTLASAAVANATVEGRPLDPGRRGFVDATRFETERRLERLVPDARVGVTAVWRPYEGAPVSGRVHVGERPPGTADVHAATLSVPSGVAVDRNRLDAAETHAQVAKTVSRAVIDALFPDTARHRLRRDDGPARAVLAARYRGVAAALDVTIEDDLTAGGAAAVERRLTRALAEELTADLEAQFESPEDARAALAADRVLIVVRTWSR